MSEQYDVPIELKAGEYIINRGAAERVLTQEQWARLKKLLEGE